MKLTKEQEQALQTEIYSGWAYTEDENRKQKVNREVYNIIKDLAIATNVGTGYATSSYKVTPVEGVELTMKQKALIADRGNLCFGYRVSGDTIIIHTD